VVLRNKGPKQRTKIYSVSGRIAARNGGANMKQRRSNKKNRPRKETGHILFDMGFSIWI
jgi:hypothetical protein